MKGFLEEGHYRLFDFLDESNKNKKLILTPRETMKTAIITAGVAIQEITPALAKSFKLPEQRKGV